MITYHGLVSATQDSNPPSKSERNVITFKIQADSIIPYRGTRDYYNAVTTLDPKIHDFYRLFEAPGLGHCNGGVGYYPSGTFDALVAWVERGEAPEMLEATSAANQTMALCPYPQKASSVKEVANQVSFLGDGCG